MIRKNFIPQIRNIFICCHCDKKNTDTLSSPRNHCAFCLYSLHVDKEVPGDRLSGCRGLMKPVALEYKGKKGYMLIHECQICGKRMLNKTAPDDNFDLIIRLGAEV